MDYPRLILLSPSLLLANQESLPVPRFNFFDWVCWKDTPVEYRDFGIIVGYFYKMTNENKAQIIYRILFDETSPSCINNIVDSDFATEDELESFDATTVNSLG